MYDYLVLINVGTLTGLLMAVASGVWKVAQIERAVLVERLRGDDELRQQVEATSENIGRCMRKLEIDSIGRFESARRETGEVGAAIRQKIHDMEVFSRDEFATKKSLENAIDRIDVSLEKLGDRLEKKIDAIDRRPQ